MISAGRSSLVWLKKRTSSAIEPRGFGGIFSDKSARVYRKLDLC